MTLLYLDDGSLCITKRVNHKKKIIYLSPIITFYLQWHKKGELLSFKKYIFETFQINLSLNKRKDGHGYRLKMTKTQDVYNFLAKTIIDCDCIHLYTNKREALAMLEPLFSNLKLTKKLKNSLWLLVRLLCDCTFQLQNRLYLHPPFYLLGLGTSNSFHCPTKFIVVALALDRVL